MKQNTDLMVTTGGALPAPAARQPADGEETFDVLGLLRRALRGQWLKAIVLGLTIAPLLAYAGWKATKPAYRSEGVIRIDYTRPGVIQDREEMPPLEVWEAFVESQAALIGSRDLVEKALDQEVWKATGLGKSDNVIGGFAVRLNVESRPNKGLVKISFLHHDPKIAAAAVRAIINAYTEVYHQQSAQFEEQRIKLLEEQHTKLEKELTSIEQEMRNLAAESGEANVDRLYEAKAVQLAKLQETLSTIKLAQILKQGQPGIGKNAAASKDLELALTPEQIATADPTMRAYLTEREKWEDAVKQMQSRGVLQSHPDMVRAAAVLQQAEARVQKYADEVRRRPGLAPAGTAATGGAELSILSLMGQSMEALQSHEAAIEKIHEQAKGEMLALEAKRQSLVGLRMREKNVSEELSRVEDRMRVLRIESSVAGRMSVIQNGDVPLSPFKDRRLTLAGAGFVGGAGLPLAMFLLIGLIKTRYQYSEEAEADLAGRMPLLGILPMLPDHMTDPERAIDAAQCVHQIRVMLQVGAGSKRCAVYLLSSASPGEGKTSLTAALGLSFAACGSRTLLIDCDLVGQKLSKGFDAEAMSGLHEALGDASLLDHVRQTTRENLWILPVGRADALYANTLSAAALQRLLEEARQHYDVVLIDSGPILGSVEASTVATQVDGVILTISRQQQRPMVERAVRHLQAIGARLVGTVFNRATPTDFSRSSTSMSVRSASNERALARVWAAGRNEGSELGPLVKAVAALLPNANGRSHSMS